MKLSIITPFYNRSNSLHNAIESVVSCPVNTKDFEIILINDGSLDQSLDIAREYENKYENVHMLSYSKNKGVNYARNRGIELAKGDYITFLDSDDIFVKGAVSEILNTIELYPSSHILFKVSSFSNISYSKKEVSYKEWLANKVNGDFLHVVRRQMLLKYPFFEHFSAYEELNWVRIIKETEPLRLCNQILVEVNRNQNNHLSNIIETNSIKYLQEKILANKYFIQLYFRDLLTYAPVVLFRRIFRILVSKACIARIKSDGKTKLSKDKMIQYLYSPIFFIYKFMK